MSDVNEFNAELGEEIFRPYTAEELSQKQADESRELVFDTTPTPENDALISALIKLQSLGLTADEAKAIVGL